jgi:hypothetical protein
VRIELAETLGAATTLNASTVTFQSTLNGARTLMINAATSAVFTGAVGASSALTSLTVNSPSITASSIRTSSFQLYNGALTTSGSYQTSNGTWEVTGNTTLAGNTTISTGSGNVTFGGTINGARSLVINDSGTNTFNGAIGDTTALASIRTDAPGSSLVNGNVTTSGSIQFLDGTTAPGVLRSINDSLIHVRAAAAASLGTIWTAGDVIFDGTAIGTSGTPLLFQVTPDSIEFTQLATAFLQGPAGTVPPIAFVNGSSIQYNSASIAQSAAEDAADDAAGNASQSIAAVIVEEANKTFGTDSVAEDVEYGFSGEIGATPPMDHRIDESGISVPRCVQEAREGLPCK